MVTRDERYQITQDHEVDDATAAAAVAKCLAGLLVIAIIAMIGSESEGPERETSKSSAHKFPAATAHVRSSTAATQQTMEERRERLRSIGSLATIAMPLSSAEASIDKRTLFDNEVALPARE
jgi:hypothetical protein